MFAPSSSVTFVVNLACVLAGILAFQLLNITSEFAREYPADYLWAAIKKIKFFIACVLLIELLIGKYVVFSFLHFCMQKFRGAPVDSLESGFLAVLAGVVTAAIPKIGERGLTQPLIGALGRPVTAIVRSSLSMFVWLGDIALKRVGESAQTILQQDNIDWHEQQDSHSWWYVGSNPTLTGRATRMVYEYHKVNIAKKRMDPRFLVYDADIYPGHKFYLIAKHLGRKHTRKALRNPPQLGEWDGHERRKKAGRTHPNRRVGDDPRFLPLVKEGKDC